MATESSVLIYQLPSEEINDIPIREGQMFFETNKGDDGKILFDHEGNRLRIGGSGYLRTIRGTLLANAWSTNAPYVQMISVNGMTEYDKPIPILVKENLTTVSQKKLIQKEFDYIVSWESGENTVKVVCQFNKPTQDLIIEFKGE